MILIRSVSFDECIPYICRLDYETRNSKKEKKEMNYLEECDMDADMPS